MGRPSSRIGSPPRRKLARAGRTVALSPSVSLELPPGEKGFLFNAQTGDLYVLNRVGAFIVRQFAAGKSILNVAETIALQYRVAAEEALADVLAFADQLKGLGIGSSRS
ncbi:MAG: PqqD family protein [Deltaproteobacteria bacterium]|nr:PqqD family protein [Deltaproteobacteria bacterium]